MFNFTVRMVLQAIDRATGPLAAVGRAVQRVGGMPRAVGQALDRLSTNIGLPNVAQRGLAAAQSLGQVVGAAGMAGVKLAALAGIGGGGLLGLTRQTAAYAEQMLVLSEKTGIPVERFQQMAFAADQSSVSAESFGEAMKFLNANMTEARMGSAEAMQWFRAAGISLNDAAGKAKTADSVVLELAAAFEKSSNAGAKTKVAMGLLGRSGVDMIPLLNGGRQSMEDLMDEAVRLRLVMGKDAVEAGEAFGDQLSKLWQVTRMGGLAIGSALIPHLTPLVGKLIELSAELQPIIASGAAEWFASLGDVMPQVITALGELWNGARMVGSAIAWLGETFGFGTLAVVGLTAMIAGPVLIAIANLAGALTMLGHAVAWSVGKLALLVFGPIVAAAGAFFSALTAGMPIITAFNVALSANPIGVVIIAVVALGAAIAATIIYWDQIVDAVGRVSQALREGLGAALDWVSAKFDATVGRAFRAIQSLGSVLPDGVRRALGLGDAADGTGSAAMAPAAAMPASRTLSAARGTAAGQSVDGQIVVRLEGDGAANARVEQVRSSGPLDIGLDLGPTMVGAP
jgi:hypothetical protein